MALRHLSWSGKSVGLDFVSPVQISETTTKGAQSCLKSGKVWRLNHSWNRQQSEPLPWSTHSSVNDSYSACAVVYSFPAVKGCPLKVPFVHRLHFVNQIALFSKWLEVAGCPWVPQGCWRLSSIQRSGTTFFLQLWNESPPLYLPFPPLFLFKALYIYIHIHIYI